LCFYIHPSFGPKITFQSYSYTFSSKFDDFIYLFIRNGKKFGIRRGLRALGDCEFPMPSNIAGIVGTCRELSVDVVETVPPQKKI